MLHFTGDTLGLRIVTQPAGCGTVDAPRGTIQAGVAFLKLVVEAETTEPVVGAITTEPGGHASFIQPVIGEVTTEQADVAVTMEAVCGFVTPSCGGAVSK